MTEIYHEAGTTPLCENFPAKIKIFIIVSLPPHFPEENEDVSDTCTSMQVQV